MKKLLYFSVATSFLAANLFTISLGAVQLSLYRVSLIGAIFFIGLMMLGLKSTATLPVGRGNGFSICFMLIWFAWGLLSFAWAKDLSMWAKAIYFLGTGTFWTVCYSMFFTEEQDFKIVFNTMQGAIIFVGLIGWYEVLTKDYRFIPMTPENIHAFVNAPARVPIALSGNPNDFATVVLFGIFISFICFQINQSLFGKMVSLYGMASAGGLLLFSESRANLLGLVMGLGLLVFVIFHEKKKTFLLIILGVFGFLVFASTPYYTKILEKIISVMQFNFNAGEFNSESVRVNLIINGLYFLTKTCWIGTGAGNIEYWMEHDTYVNTNGYVNIHNWWVEILASFGAFLFLLYLVFYVALFCKLFQKYRTAHDAFTKNASLGLLCCMAAFIIGSISSSSNMKTEWLWMFWAVVIAFEGYQGNTVSLSSGESNPQSEAS